MTAWIKVQAPWPLIDGIYILATCVLNFTEHNDLIVCSLEMYAYSNTSSKF